MTFNRRVALMAAAVTCVLIWRYEAALFAENIQSAADTIFNQKIDISLLEQQNQEQQDVIDMLIDEYDKLVIQLDVLMLDHVNRTNSCMRTSF